MAPQDSSTWFKRVAAVADLICPPGCLALVRRELFVLRAGCGTGARGRERTLSLSLHLASSHPGEPHWDLLTDRLKLNE
jgi:hypothetical protein